ncbi:adenylate/guanylate cyclase domain-containing protein [Geminicoccus harenae]|uniref:adenylate/guanylate cyclase domain-containing protein n=1 Tax=Geminicoccus harenae TaxID=2498453 RepID=UPI00168B60FA|nr:adenylate/guanylate cyclase domain-containing protein [Geminicoccus harenae]
MDVQAWLRSIGLERYAEAFRIHAIDADLLPRLSADDLKEIGVTALGDRRRLLDAAAARCAGTVPVGAIVEGERRQVTVLFADLAGYTALASELDAEEVHALLQRFLGQVDAVVHRHGGHVDKHIGDCVMAVFGVPVAHGNDAERAVGAALGIRDAMPVLSAELGRKMQVHVGIAAGQVVAGGTGSNGHRAFTVTGESVNLAARLTDAAAPGEILMSDAVRRSLAGRLDCEEISALRVKGFAEPVRSWRLHALRAAAAERPLVGRKRELEQLRTLVVACRETGQGATIHLRGDAGIGKTRLVEELRKLALEAGFACHTGLVLDFGTGIGRDAIRSLLRSLLSLDLAADAELAGTAAAAALTDGLVAPDDAVFLNDLLDLPQSTAERALLAAMDDATRSMGKRRVLAGLVERISRRQPLLLVVEDLHWAQAPLLPYLARLAATVATCRALLVLTSRIERDPLDRAWRSSTGNVPLTTIDLGPLQHEEAMVLADALFDAAEQHARRCVARAGGNPLFLEQLLRHAEEHDGSSVPGSVQSLVQARLDRLPPLDRSALQAASVLGQRFERDALRHLLAQPDYAPERLEQHLLVRPQGEAFLFGHALIRDAVYDSLLRSRRRMLHRQAAAWYAERDALLHAEHLERAGDPGAAAAYLRAAAQQAASYRYGQALRLIERGQALAVEHADRFALTCLRAEVQHDLGDMAAARQAFEASRSMARSKAEQCRALIGLAMVKRIIDDLDGAALDLRDAEAAAMAADLLAEQAHIHFLRGNLCFPQGDIAGCLSEHRQSLELARDAGSAEAEAAALGGLGDAEYARGRMRSAYAHFHRCIELCRGHGFGRIEVANLPMAAFTRLYAGDVRGGLADSLDAIAATARVGHGRAEIIAHHSACLCQLSLGDPAAGLRHAESATALSRRLGARRFEGESLAFRGEQFHALGRWDEAHADVVAGLAICRETGMSYVGPVVLGILAKITPDIGEAEAALEEGLALLQNGSISHNHLLFLANAIEACLARGHWARVERFAQALENYTAPEPMPWADFLIARGRILAAHGQGDCGDEVTAGLRRLLATGERIGLLAMLPLVRAALGKEP